MSRLHFNILHDLKLILILASLLLAGCSASVVYTIYNNTRWNLVVELRDERRVWIPGTPLHIDKDIQGRLEWISANGQYFPVLKVRQDQTEAVFKFTSPEYPIAEEYAGKRGGRQEYRFQLQEDWNLYILKPEAAYPAVGRNIRFQPPGFPISGK